MFKLLGFGVLVGWGLFGWVFCGVWFGFFFFWFWDSFLWFVVVVLVSFKKTNPGQIFVPYKAAGGRGGWRGEIRIKSGNMKI